MNFCFCDLNPILRSVDERSRAGLITSGCLERILATHMAAMSTANKASSDAGNRFAIMLRYLSARSEMLGSGRSKRTKYAAMVG